MSFNILRLPYLARKEIFQQMTLVDLFEFSQCSKKTKRLIKSEYKTKKHDLWLAIDTEFSFVLQDNYVFNVAPKKRLDKKKTVQRQQIGRFNNIISHQDVYQNGELTIETYWSDTLMGAKQMWKELNELFRFKFDTVQIDFDAIEIECKPLIRWINRIEPRPESYNFDSADKFGLDYMEFEQYMWILEHVKSEGHVEMGVRPKEFLEKKTLNIETKSLGVVHAEWIRIEHLKSMKCSTISIMNVKLTETDLNRFMKDLVAGSNPELIDIIIASKRDFDMDVVLDGLNATEETIEDVETWRVSMENEDTFTVERIEFKEERNVGIKIHIERRR